MREERVHRMRHRTSFHKSFILTVPLLVREGGKESAIQSSIYRMFLWYFFG